MPKEEPKQVSPEVPTEVKDSIVEAGKAPEAAGNTEAVEDKKLVEAELLKEVKPAATIDETPQVAPEVPTEVKDSIVEAGERPEAAASAEAVENKKEVEAQLLKEAEPVPAVDDTKPDSAVESKTEESAPVVPAVVVPAETKTEEPKTEAPKTEESTAKTETSAVGNGSSTAGNGTTATGNGASTTETKPADSSRNGSASAASGKEKKKNRLSSMFSKIKHKFSDK